MQRSFALELLLACAALVVICAGIVAAKTILAPFLLSIFFAVILVPPLRWLKRKGVSETVAILLLSTVIFLLGLGTITVVGSSLSRFSGKLPTYQKKLTEGLKQAEAWKDDLLSHLEKETIDRVLPPTESPATAPPPTLEWHAAAPETEAPEAGVSEIAPADVPGATLALFGGGESKKQTPAFPDGKASEAAHGLSDDVLTTVLNPKMLASMALALTREVAGMMSIMLVVMVTVIFMLLEAARFPDKVKAAFGERLETTAQLDEIAKSIWDYTVIKGWISLATGAATWIFLWFCGVEYALLWGLLAFFFNFIPNVGPIISSVPPILLAWVDHSFGTMLFVTAGLIVINFAIGYGVEPFYLGDGLGISGLVVLLSLIFWGWLLGPVGMFLSAPLTMIVKIVLQTYEQTRWIAILLGPAAPKTPGKSTE